jgi:hypothetical protein
MAEIYDLFEGNEWRLKRRRLPYESACLFHFTTAAVLTSRKWLEYPYVYVKIVCMKKTLNIDDKLLDQAKVACGAATGTETIRLGLEALVRHAAYERLRALRGSEPRARDVPRRRSKPPVKRKLA